VGEALRRRVTSKSVRDSNFCRDGATTETDDLQPAPDHRPKRELKVRPAYDFAIYSRKELGRMMRLRAVTRAPGSTARASKNTEFVNGKWRSKLVMAISPPIFWSGGRRDSVIRRRAGLKFEPKGFRLRAAGMSKPGRKRDPGRSEIRTDEFSGILWLFRAPYISYGVASGFQETTPARLKAKLIDFIETQDRELARELKTRPGKFDSARELLRPMIPSLDVSTWMV